MPPILVQSATCLALFLVIASTLSFLGAYHWGFALLSHFKIQYCIGGLILCAFFLISGNPVLSLCMLCVALGSYVKTRDIMVEPWNFNPPEYTSPSLTVAQYNKYYKNERYSDISKSLQSTDLITMLEVWNHEKNKMRNAFSKTHPYSTPVNKQRPDTLFVLSKYEIQNMEFKKVAPEICETLGVRFEITTDENITFVIYTIHTRTPFGKNAAIHEAELRGMAQWIAKDSAEHILFMGDWNTTPYAPIFHDVLTHSKLNYQNYGVLPKSTWPAQLALPILQIPIDHILFSDSLNLLSIEQGKAIGSDHHALIARFGLK